MAFVFIKKSIEDDCAILLTRSLLDKDVWAFGEDGLGKHGRSNMAFQFQIVDIDVCIIEFDDDTLTGKCLVSIKLDNYSSNTVGHICSDNNFMISIRKYLKDDFLDPECVSWAGIEMQGNNYASLYVDSAILTC